jgi:hypothetical protein
MLAAPCWLGGVQGDVPTPIFVACKYASLLFSLGFHCLPCLCRSLDMMLPLEYCKSSDSAFAQWHRDSEPSMGSHSTLQRYRSFPAGGLGPASSRADARRGGPPYTGGQPPQNIIVGMRRFVSALARLCNGRDSFDRESAWKVRPIIGGTVGWIKRAQQGCGGLVPHLHSLV